MKNILFVCIANCNRSRTAEIYFQNKYPQHRFRSAGISKNACEKHGGIHLKTYMLDVADRIICMDFSQSDYIIRQIDKKYNSKIEVLQIEDLELFMSPKLIEELELKFKI
jgi:protein-tyrosine-phosphatase